jgi:hypothetical protein
VVAPSALEDVSDKDLLLVALDRDALLALLDAVASWADRIGVHKG